MKLFVIVNMMKQTFVCLLDCRSGSVITSSRSRDMPYTYNGRAGLILATSYQSLNRLIKNAFEMAGTHVELKIITLDGDIIHIHPIANDNSFVMFKSDENRQ